MALPTPLRGADRKRADGPAPFTTHFIHDIFGNVIAETGGGGAFWLGAATLLRRAGRRAGKRRHGYAARVHLAGL